MKLQIENQSSLLGTGWIPPMPDLRDYTEYSQQIALLNQKLGIGGADQKVASSADLRKWCSEIDNQLDLGSCTANAGIGIVEYYQRRAFNKYIEGSRLFLYKVTRNLMQETGDTGATIRDVMKALALCGVPAEKYWPYNVADFDKDPPAFIYSIADNYEALKYFCHDPMGSDIPSATVLESVKKYLSAGIPSMFGFYGFPSFDSSDVKGGIPYPCQGESAEWGHAIVAVGYDDEKKITNTKCNKETKGALLIRNSWGASWGDKGYGWMPYDYVLSKLAMDFWSLLGMEWVETGMFGN